MPSPLVLIAEDNAISQVVAQAMLHKEGLESAIARDGEEAVEMALTTEYAAILMDCQMPGLDGYEATRQIRKSERVGRVPIIAMTARSLPVERDRYLATGMDDHISKPLGREPLREVMARWLTPGAEPIADDPGTVAAASGQRVGPSRETPVLDAATILRLRDEYPPEMRRQLLEAFELALPAAVREILSAAHHGQWTELKLAAHLLRGTSLMLGAARLGAACETMGATAARRGPQLDLERDRADRFRAIAQETSVALRRQLS
jgi:CheY-like chemotaxis protein